MDDRWSDLRSLFAFHRRATIQGVRTIIGFHFPARRGATSARAFRLLGIVRVFKHRIGGSPFFPATYIFSYYTGGREKYSAHKFRVPFVRSTLPVILSSRVSSFLSCRIHAHVRI